MVLMGMVRVSLIGKLINTIENCGDATLKDVLWVETCKRSHKFVFDTDAVLGIRETGGSIEELVRFAGQMVEAGVFALPFPEVTFEWPNIIETEASDPDWPVYSVCVIAKQVGENIEFRGYQVSVKGCVTPGTSTHVWSGERDVRDLSRAQIRVDSDPAALRRCADIYGDAPPYGSVYGSVWGSVILFSSLAILGLGSGIEQVEVKASEVLNLKRERKGKPRVYPHTAVVLDFSRTKLPGRIKEGGHHVSPRLHWRRGHVRRLPSGSVTLVRACLVGAPSGDPAVDRRYDVRPPAKRSARSAVLWGA